MAKIKTYYDQKRVWYFQDGSIAIEMGMQNTDSNNAALFLKVVKDNGYIGLITVAQHPATNIIMCGRQDAEKTAYYKVQDDYYDLLNGITL